jgi:hypothetical protein
LVGGTALALQYGHRISVDLDFFGGRMFFFLWRVAIQINFTIFAASLRIFREYPQLHCGFSENIRS